MFGMLSVPGSPRIRMICIVRFCTVYFKMLPQERYSATNHRHKTTSAVFDVRCILRSATSWVDGLLKVICREGYLSHVQNNVVRCTPSFAGTTKTRTDGSKKIADEIMSHMRMVYFRRTVQYLCNTASA